MFDIFGIAVDQGEPSYQELLLRLHPDEIDRFRNLVDRAINFGEPYATDFQIIRADGSSGYIFTKAELLGDVSGKITRLFGIVMDISDRKKAEAIAHQKAEQERLLSVITQRMRSSLNLFDILKFTVEELHQVLQCDRVLVYQVFPEGTGAVVAESVLPDYLKVLNIKFVEEVFPQEIYDRYIQGRIYTLSDREDPKESILPCLIEFLAEIQVRAKLVVPIIQQQNQQQKLWGLLIAHQCDRPRHWQDWEIALLKQVGDQLAIAIQQSDLYSQLQQQKNQEWLLREVTQRIRQSLDLQTIFKTSVEEVRQFLQADRVGIFKFYPESNFDDGEIVAESVVNGYPSAIAIRVHDHTFGENYANLYAKGRYYVVDDIYGNGDQECHVDILARFQVRANVVMPLLCGDNLWGLLCIHQCGSTRQWLQTEIDFSQKISNQLAIAIQQASLFDQLQLELAERQQTEAKLMESNQQLAVSNQELVRATRLKDEFLANMSHELRTPLNAILGMTESMLDEIFGSINDRQRKSLQTVDRSASHLLELINDILDVAKIESGQIELDCTSISVSHLCQSSLAFIKQQALKKRIQLEISQLPTNLPDLLADERRIRQVLINLLNNAVKFTPEGGRITLAVSQITSTNPETPQFLRIAIIDTGIGISAENIPKLFQPFIQIGTGSV